jgi:hypothetical protein
VIAASSATIADVALWGGAALPAPDSVSAVYFEGGWRDTPVYLLAQLLAGMVGRCRLTLSNPS